MGVNAHYSQIRRDLFEEGIKLFDEKGESAFGEFSELVYDNKIRELWLGKSFSTLYEILSGSKWGEIPNRHLGALTILGKSYSKNIYEYRYITHEDVTNINQFLKSIQLSTTNTFLSYYKQAKPIKNEDVSKQLDEYLEDEPLKWFNDAKVIIKKSNEEADKLKVQGLARLFLMESMPEFESCLVDIYYYYKYYLDLEHFYIDCEQNPNTYILGVIS